MVQLLQQTDVGSHLVTEHVELQSHHTVLMESVHFKEDSMPLEQL